MKRYRFLFIIIAVVVLITAAYSVYVTSAVDRQVKKISEAYWNRADQENVKEKSEMHKVPGYTELLKKKGLLDAMVRIAQSDSIGLFLNLPDSMAQMIVKGVGIRDIPIREMKLSPFFGKMDVEVLYELFSQPLKINKYKATIAKEPINEVQAPKDSSDANSIPMIQPDTSNMEPVFFILDTEQNVRLYFYQTEGGARDNWAGFKFGLDDRWQRAKEAMGALTSGTVPEYIPTIKIGISKEDAKVLYRALPPSGLVVITL